MSDDWKDSDDEGSENEDESTDEANEPTCLLIAIDTDPAMFELSSNGMSIFKNMLCSCYDILDGVLLKLGRGNKKLIAVAAISNVKEKIAISDFKELLPNTLKKLRSLCDKNEEELKDMFIRNEPLDLSDFFLQCKKIFTQCSKDIIKNMVYITNTDNPVGDDEDRKFHAINQAKTLNEFNIVLELLTFNQDFNYSTFFQELLFVAESKFNFQYFVDFTCLKEKLLSMIIYKGHKIRFYPFHDDTDEDKKNKYFDVVEKSFMRPAKILNNATVTKDTNKEVKRKKTGGRSATKFKYQYSKFQDHLEFDAIEKAKLIADGLPTGVILLSVMPKMLQPGMHNTDPKFIQSSDREDSYFDSFWQYCVDKNRVLVCARKSRHNTRIKLVELSPKVINNIRSFLVLGIPFQDNINVLEDPSKHSKCEAMQLQVAEEFVKALTFKYNPMKFHNVVYCKKKDFVRSQLLDEPPAENFNSSEIEIKEEDVNEAIEKFKEICFVDVVAKKRKTTTVKAETKSKKKK